ncbi:MAG: hypothetical protein WBC93_02775, partial [Sulfitobacter sp.]
IKIAEIQAKGPGYLVEWAKSRWAWEKQKRAGGQDMGPVTPGAEFNNLKVKDAFLEAVGKYEAPTWEGAVTLLRPPLDRHWKVTGGNWVSAQREYVFEDNDWRKHAPHLEVIEVPGDHDSMVLTPNVTTLAQELREVIAQALPEGGNNWQQATAAE